MFVERTPREKVRDAVEGLRHIWMRWHLATDNAERARLWLLVKEAELRVRINKKMEGDLADNVCPDCRRAGLLAFKNEDGSLSELCRACGWTDGEELMKIVREATKRPGGRRR